MKGFLNRLLNRNGPLLEITQILLQTLQVNVTNTTLRKELEEHPDFPGILSMSDVLNKHGVPNVAAIFDAGKLPELPTPFITQIGSQETGQGEYTVVRSTTDNTVHFYQQTQHKWSSEPMQEFLKKYSGLVLLPEAEENAGESMFIQKRNSERWQVRKQYLMVFLLPLLILIPAVTSLLDNPGTQSLPFAYSMLTIAGSLLGGLLIWHELDRQNPALQQICSTGKKVNCDAVLHSKASKIGGISWSAIGTSYFLSGMLMLLVNGTAHLPTLSVLAWMNALAAPYVIFSVYYQWRVAKQWCLLCLSVQAILLAQLSVFIAGNWYQWPAETPFTASVFFHYLSCIAVPMLVLAIILPMWKNLQMLGQQKTSLQRFKYDPVIFETMLSSQKQLTETPEGLGLIFGNAHAKHRIIKVCNPYCGPCAQAHKPLEELLKNNPDVQVQIIFTPAASDKKALPVKHFMAIAEESDQGSRIQQALDEWYDMETKDYETFAPRHPINSMLAGQDAKADAMSEWCKKAGISFTPTFFINGRQLPDPYNISDLQYFLDSKS